MKLLVRWIVLLLAAVGGAMVVTLVVIMSKDSSQHSAQPETASQAPPPPVKAVSMTPYYSIVDGYEYGYKPALSDVDLQEGQGTKALVMIKFLGARDGRLQLAIDTGRSLRQVMDCARPCDIVRVRVFSGGRMLRKEFLTMEPNTIMQLAFADASKGLLKPYQLADGKYLVVGEDHRQTYVEEAPGLRW